MDPKVYGFCQTSNNITLQNMRGVFTKSAPFIISKLCEKAEILFYCSRSAVPKMSSISRVKQVVAHHAVDRDIKNGDVVGIGSGSTIVYAVERLAERVESEKLVVSCVPSSFQARQLIVQHKLPLTDLDVTPVLDICIDGADEVDSDLNLVKGGGGCLLQEKIVASCAKQFVVIADYTKCSKKFGDQYLDGIPIEVVPLACVPIKLNLEKRYQGKFVLRMAQRKAGPVVTDNGNFILDWKDFNKDSNWEEVNKDISMIPGVVETGLFVKMAHKAYFGMADGSVKVQC